MNASDPAEAAPPEDAAPEAAATVEDAVPEPAAAEPPAEADGEDEEEEEDRGEPLFEVSDRRATILADRVGIIFRLDGEEADFTWDEIGAVEIDTPRFSKRFEVTVYTGPRRWFEAHVEAKSRGLLKTWTAELDAVLDAHFEASEDSEGSGETAKAPKPAEAAETTEAAEPAKSADAAKTAAPATTAPPEGTATSSTEA